MNQFEVAIIGLLGVLSLVSIASLLTAKVIKRLENDTPKNDFEQYTAGTTYLTHAGADGSAV